MLKSEHLSKIRQAYGSLLPGSKLEIEFRFGRFNGSSFDSTVKGPVFSKLKRWLFNNIKTAPKESTFDSYTYERQYRKRVHVPTNDVDPMKVVWQLKDKANQLQFNYNDYDFRLAVAKETIIDEPANADKLHFLNKRNIHRLSWKLFDGKYRLDLSEVASYDALDIMRGVPEKGEEKEVRHRYEIELEFKGTLDEFDSSVYNVIETVFKWVHGTELVYTATERDDLIRDVNGCIGFSPSAISQMLTIDKNNIVEARNLHFADMVWGGLVGNPTTYYTVTYKADGLRKLLIVHPAGIWLVFPPFEYNLIFRVDPNTSELHREALSIYDGELIPYENRRGNGLTKKKYWYMVFDCLAYLGDADIQTKSHNVRRRTVENSINNKLGGDNLINQIMDLEMKTFYPLQVSENKGQGVDWVFNQIQNLLLGRDNQPFVEDGLMFTPNNAYYNPHSEIATSKEVAYLKKLYSDKGKELMPAAENGRYLDENKVMRVGTVYNRPLSMRVLTKYPDICKWKPDAKMTIDFKIRIKQNMDGKSITLLTKKDNTRQGVHEYKEFVGDEYHPFNGRIDTNNSLLEHAHSGAIVEFAWDKHMDMFVPVIIRNDKTQPNKHENAMDNWNMAHDPITEDDLSGRNFTLLYKAHNKIKRSLFREIPPGASLLDIGSGIGGDTAKMGHLGKIVFVEPDVNKLEELNRRINLNKLTSRSIVVNTVGENSNLITQEVTRHVGGKVDAITMMFSMTFFWGSNETLDGLLKTIMDNLKEGGHIYFITMDGDIVKSKFDPGVNGVTYNRLEFQSGGNEKSFIDYLWDDPDNISRKDERHKILVDLVDSKTARFQYEWLVYLSNIIVRQPELSFEMRKQAEPNPNDKNDTNERFLPSDARLFSSFFTYGKIKRAGSGALTKESFQNSQRRASRESSQSKGAIQKSAPQIVEAPKVDPANLTMITGPKISIPPPNLNRGPKISVPPANVNRNTQSNQSSRANVPPSSTTMSVPSPNVSSVPVPNINTSNRTRPVKSTGEPISRPVVPRGAARLKTADDILERMHVYPNYKAPDEIADGDDRYLPLKCSWFDSLVRIATLGEGSCFFHAILKAFYPAYQNDPRYSARARMAKVLRHELALLIAQEDEVYNLNEEHLGHHHTFWETVSGGEFIEHTLDEIYDPTWIARFGNDYSLRGIQLYLDSTKDVGEELYKFISDKLGIDVYVVRGTLDDLLIHNNTSDPNNRRNAVVIMGNTEHYEVVGVDTGANGFQTFFPPDHPFIQTILVKSGGSLSRASEVNVDLLFAERIKGNLILDRSVARDSGTLISPQEIRRIFSDDDPMNRLLTLSIANGLISQSMSE